MGLAVLADPATEWTESSLGDGPIPLWCTGLGLTRGTTTGDEPVDRELPRLGRGRCMTDSVADGVGLDASRVADLSGVSSACIRVAGVGSKRGERSVERLGLAPRGALSSTGIEVSKPRKRGVRSVLNSARMGLEKPPRTGLEKPLLPVGLRGLSGLLTRVILVPNSYDALCLALGRGRSMMLPLGLVGLYRGPFGLAFGLCGLSSNSGDVGEFPDSFLTTIGAGARPVGPCFGVGSWD